jgi:oligopeptide transport system substrate-binding protein
MVVIRRRPFVLGAVSLLANPFRAMAAPTAKTFRINVVADPAQLDPITLSEIVAGRILDNMYEGFIITTRDGRNIPALAESWDPLSPDPGFRFHLRQGVRLHSGRTFAANDVQYTFEQLLRPDSKGGLAAPYLVNVVGAAEFRDSKASSIAGLSIVDDHTIEVRFTKPDVLFPIYPFRFMDSGIVAEKGADWMLKVSAGTGPFKFRAWRRGVDVELTANPSYWGAVPKIEGVRFLVVPTAETTLAQYDAGELDFVDVYQSAIRRVVGDQRYGKELIRVPRAQSNYLGINQALYKPFSDKRVRQALSLSIDREAMIRGLYGGAAFMQNGVVPPGFPGCDPSIPAPKFDPKQAQALLEAAGYPGGKGMPPVDISATEAQKDELAYYADQFHRVLGINVSVKVVERATFIRAMNAGQVALFRWGWTMDYPDPATFLHDMWYSSSPYNRARWKNAEYDALIDKALTTPDEAARYELYHEAERIIVNDFGMVPLPIPASVGLCKPNVHNVTLTPFGFSRFNRTTID